MVKIIINFSQRTTVLKNKSSSSHHFSIFSLSVIISELLSRIYWKLTEDQSHPISSNSWVNYSKNEKCLKNYVRRVFGFWKLKISAPNSDGCWAFSPNPFHDSTYFSSFVDLTRSCSMHSSIHRRHLNWNIGGEGKKRRKRKNGSIWREREPTNQAISV